MMGQSHLQLQSPLKSWQLRMSKHNSTSDVAEEELLQTNNMPLYFIYCFVFVFSTAKYLLK